VRRAFPYVPADEVEPLIEAHADSLFRLVHARSFGVATQALLLLFQLMSSRSTVSDRFYRALYAVLCSPELQRSSKAPMFLSLLFKARAGAAPAALHAVFLLRFAAQQPDAPCVCCCRHAAAAAAPCRPHACRL
jgi:ribosome biogenesis protein MAK21